MLCCELLSLLPLTFAIVCVTAKSNAHPHTLFIQAVIGGAALVMIALSIVLIRRRRRQHRIKAMQRREQHAEQPEWLEAHPPVELTIVDRRRAPDDHGNDDRTVVPSSLDAAPPWEESATMRGMGGVGVAGGSSGGGGGGGGGENRGGSRGDGSRNDRSKPKAFVAPSSDAAELRRALDSMPIVDIALSQVQLLKVIETGESPYLVRRAMYNAGWDKAIEATAKSIAGPGTGVVNSKLLDMLREIAAMSQFSHRNVVALIGVVWKGTPLPGHPMVLYEHLACGPLDRYLRKAKPSLQSRLMMSAHVAAGVEYLCSVRYGFALSSPAYHAQNFLRADCLDARCG